MKFTSLYPLVENQVFQFRESLNSLSRESGFTLTKIDECPYQVFIASTSSISLGMEKADDRIIALSTQKKGDFPRDLFRNDLLPKISDGFIGEIIPYPFENPNLEIIRISAKQFILFLSKLEDVGNSLVALQIISNIWQLDQGRIPLHTAGILHKAGLYLFSGPSGAGKSTVSFFSLNIGDQVFDEDQLMIYKRIRNTYSANAWGKNYGKFQAPIRGFFWLVKSKTDRLLPLSSKLASKRIWEQSLQALGGILPAGNRKSLFIRINGFARTIPTYELHFRQSSDFWQLIDAQIPYD